MEQAQNYFVDVDRLTAFLRTLSAAQTVEEKTAKPEYYPRLGVEDISADGASVEVGLFWSNQNKHILFGNAQGEYRYARVADQPTAWLIDADLNFSLDASGLVSFGVSQYHGDRGAKNQTSSTSDGEVNQLLFVVRMASIKQMMCRKAVNSNIASYCKLRSVQHLFNLDFDQVRPASNSETDAVTTFQLSDGARVVFSRVSANKEDDSERRCELVQDSVTIDRQGQTTVLSATQAEALRKATEGWEFKLSGYKADQIVQRMEDLLSAVE